MKEQAGEMAHNMASCVTTEPTFFEMLLSVTLEMAPYLLFGLLVAGIVHVMIEKSFVLQHFGGHGLWSVVKASLLGVPLPLCSCSVVPTAMTLKKSGASDASTMSFLISTPQTGVDSIAATWGMMGPLLAIFRPLTAFLTGIVGGVVTSVATPQEEKIILMHPQEEIVLHRSLSEKVKEAFRYGFVELMDDLAANIFIGIVISAAITTLIPVDYREKIILLIGDKVLLQMLLVMAVAIPLYVCSTGSIPIALSLSALGFSPAAAFVFLMTGPATNAATITIITQKLGVRFGVIYVSTIMVMAVPFGFLLEYLISFWPVKISLTPHTMEEISVWSWLFVTIFILLIIRSIWHVKGKVWLKKFLPKKTKSLEYSTILTVEGMTCQNCARHVTEAAESVVGIEKAEVNLETNQLLLWGDAAIEEVLEVVKKAGYKPQR